MKVTATDCTLLEEFRERHERRGFRRSRIVWRITPNHRDNHPADREENDDRNLGFLRPQTQAVNQSTEIEVEIKTYGLSRLFGLLGLSGRRAKKCLHCRSL